MPVDKTGSRCVIKTFSQRQFGSHFKILKWTQIQINFQFNTVVYEFCKVTIRCVVTGVFDPMYLTWTQTQINALI